MDETQKLREEDLRRLKNFRLLDDDFLGIVFNSDIEATELVLNIILDRNDLSVTSVVGQRELKKPIGRSVRLDIHAVDSKGKQYDVEVQRADKGASAQRARFNSSMMDTRMLKPGDEYSELADSYVIFITENDILNKGLPLYHIDRIIKETGKDFQDGSHIIYVNGAYKNDEDAIGKLMHDFRCTQADEMKYELLADRVRYFKENEGGIETMCKAMEDMRNKAAYNADLNARKTIAVSLWKSGEDIDTIASITELTVEVAEKAIDEASQLCPA